MTARRLACVALVCLLAAVPAGCGENTGEDVALPRREGLALELEGFTYNVFITRQLNGEDVEDQGYLQTLRGARPGFAYFGVFMEVCNIGDEALQPAGSFVIEDTQGNEFEPLELAEDNPFAYQPALVDPGECIPEVGSVASESPTGGALLVFEIPIEATENRPLELIIRDGFDVETAQPHELRFELDI
jgi:hypothetical protein